MASRKRRGGSSITNLLSDITDDIKDFIDDEIIDRGRDFEKDARKAVRRATEDRDDYDTDEVAELRVAVEELTEKIAALSMGSKKN
jgi:uncharacterized protein YbjQ (UPF0145 family)